MHLTITSESRFSRTPDGTIWGPGIKAYPFWTRYLNVFDQVRVAARLREVSDPEPGNCPAAGAGVTFLPLPDYLGLWEFLGNAVRVRNSVLGAFRDDGAIILPVSSQLSGILESHLAAIGRPYGVEVVNDPYDVYAPGSVRSPLRPVFRWWFTRQLRRQCRGAAGAAYVTERVLQQRYPCPRYETGISNVEIGSEAFVSRSRRFSSPLAAVRLVTVASLTQIYKAPDVLLRAFAQCIREGLNLELRVIGDGRFRPEMERLARDLGVPHRVRFLGQLPAGSAVREQLDAADLFVLPSRCEGLPRAMAEAMARSLPCIGSTVGGIPELLPPEDLVPPGDVAALAGKIREVIETPERMAGMASRNLDVARRYHYDLLALRRRDFLEQIRRATAAWQAGRARSGAASEVEAVGC